MTIALQAIDCNLADAYEEVVLAKKSSKDEHDEWSESTGISINKPWMVITQRHYANVAPSLT